MSNPFETRIDRLELANFKGFTNLTIDFEPNLTVIVAENGLGKTAVLDAVATSLRPFADGMRGRLTGVGFRTSDVRLVLSPERTMERANPNRIVAYGMVTGEPGNWERVRRLPEESTSTTSPTIDAAHVREQAAILRRHVLEHAEGSVGTPPHLPVIAYYGAGRFWQGASSFSDSLPIKGRKTDQVSPPDTSRASGYVFCLSPSTKYRTFETWFGRFAREAQDEMVLGRASAHMPRVRLQAVRVAVGTVLALTGWQQLEWDNVREVLVATHPIHGRLPIAFLSDGIRNMIGLAGDLAHRCIRLNPHLGEQAAERTNGIVLIDEVDMHLHPAWQQTVIASLTTAFPKIQFIVTTHSPQVLSTVDRQSIRILQADGTVALPRYQTRGVASADVLATAMGVDPIPDVPEWAQLRQYRAVIERGAWQEQEAIALRAELEAHFGADHPLMLDCDRLIRFQSFRLRRSPAGSESL